MKLNNILLVVAVVIAFFTAGTVLMTKKAKVDNVPSQDKNWQWKNEWSPETKTQPKVEPKKETPKVEPKSEKKEQPDVKPEKKKIFKLSPSCPNGNCPPQN